MTFDEAMSKAVLGFRVRCESMQQDSFIYYEFSGFRQQFMHNGRVGSSTGWWADDGQKEENWIIIGEHKVEPWPDFEQTNWNVDAAVDIPDEPIMVPSCWEINNEPEAKQTDIKKGWAIFDAAK